MLKDTLQGRPLKLPLHAVLVHAPIGLLLLSALLDLGSFINPSNSLVRGSFYAMAFGVGMALGASVPGLADWLDIRKDHPAKKTATTHMVLNLAALAGYGINLALRVPALEAATVPWYALIMSLVGFGLITLSGYLGGAIVYGDGIGVGRHRRTGETPKETLHVSAGEAEDHYVTIAPAASVREGEMLRVEVDGTALAILKLEGEYHAFQDFCTHRFGPLSEGSVRQGQVRCPWHGSCFDVRTGEVTQGPAKEDLKTYKVSERDGDIVLAVPQGKAKKRRERVAA